MKSRTAPLRVLYAASDESADMLYLSGVFVPDPFLALIHGNRSIAIVNRLEYGRMQSHSKFDEVLLLEQVSGETANYMNLPYAKIGPVELVTYFSNLWGMDRIEVPQEFPALHFSGLQDAGLTVQVGPAPFFSKRVLKTDAELRAIREGNLASAAGIRLAGQVLREASIVGNRLKYKGHTLTSERLRCMIDQTCLSYGGQASHTIVAGGRQACDPHQVGYGPLKPNELIIIDVFPRISKTGYHGDMTRTFLKGKASAAQRHLVGSVRSAQQAALKQIKAGRSAASVHLAAEKMFLQHGYLTEQRSDGFVGFIHSVGHGLGLEVHEAPRVGKSRVRLRRGHVITVEPGLYYPETGGCRIEDVVHVTTEGYKKLSACSYAWELA